MTSSRSGIFVWKQKRKLLDNADVEVVRWCLLQMKSTCSIKPGRVNGISVDRKDDMGNYVYWFYNNIY